MVPNPPNPEISRIEVIEIIEIIEIGPISIISIVGGPKYLKKLKSGPFQLSQLFQLLKWWGLKAISIISKVVVTK